jgi:hypothetical protein
MSRVKGMLVREDFVVGRSLSWKSGRGVYCLSFRKVEPGEKLLPFWRPNPRYRRTVAVGDKFQYWFGDGHHGYINLEGAEDEGILSGLINDNLSFDDRQVNCYIEWDDESQMYWVRATFGWPSGTVCELTLFYGIAYWVWNQKLLRAEDQVRLWNEHRVKVQKVIDDENVVFINPITGTRVPKTGDPPRVTFGPNQIRTIRDTSIKTRGRPPIARRKYASARARDTFGQFS